MPLTGFLTRGPTVGEPEIAAFESRCGFQLPADYRQFLMDQNGGQRLVVRQAPRRDEELSGTVWFYSLGAAGTLGELADELDNDPLAWPEAYDILVNDLDRVVEACRNAGSRSYPRELLPVARPLWECC